MMKTFALLALGLCLSASAFAEEYDCHPSKRNAYFLKDEMLEVDQGQGVVYLGGETLRLDPTYRPKVKKDFKRYAGDTRFLEEESLRGARIDVLVSEKVTPIRRNMIIRVHEDGGYTDDFFVCIDIQAGT